MRTLAKSRQRKPAAKPKRLAKPATRPKRANPGEQARAATLSAAFHGRPAKEITDYVTSEFDRIVLTDLGALRSLAVRTVTGRAVTLEFPARRAPRVASSPDGGQLYFVGGDQTLDLDALGLTKTLPKDHIEIGQVEEITYRTSKAFHDFAPIDYYHAFGEAGGRPPALHYDALNETIYLTGGTYQVRPEGITK